MADKIHCVKKTLHLTPYEAYNLSEKAKKAGMCEAEYLRMLISQRSNDYAEVRIIIRNLINEVSEILLWRFNFTSKRKKIPYILGSF